MTETVSIVTPSFNQGEFIEFCLKTISAERVSGHVEHLVVDGGSTDSSPKTIADYSGVLDYWRSKPDNGQSDAINAGMALAKGDILCWINSDDGLAPGAVALMREAIGGSGAPAWGIGECAIIDEKGARIGVWQPSRHDELDFILEWRRNYIMQPAVFWNRRMWEAAGPLEEPLHYAMDFDLWLRFFQISKPVLVHKVIGMHRRHGNSKTSLVGSQIYEEYLWALEKRLSTDRRRKRLGQYSVCRALCERANVEIFYGNYRQSIEAMRKAFSISPLAMADASFLKAGAKLIARAIKAPVT